MACWVCPTGADNVLRNTGDTGVSGAAGGDDLCTEAAVTDMLLAVSTTTGDMDTEEGIPEDVWGRYEAAQTVDSVGNGSELRSLL